MMKRLGRSAALLILLFLAFVCAGAWLASGTLHEWVRIRIAAGLSDALSLPCSIASIDWRLRRMNVEVGDAQCGEGSGRVALSKFSVAVHPWASIRERRPVISAALEKVRIDLTQLPEMEMSVEQVPVTHAPHVPPSIPAFRVAELTIRGLDLQFPYDPRDVAGVHLSFVGVRAESSSPSAIAGELTLVGGVFERKGAVLRVHSIHVSGGWNTNDGLSVDSGQIEGEGITGNIRREGPGLHRAQARFETEILGAFVDELIFLNGHAAAEGRLEGDLANPVVRASVHLANGAIAGRPVGDLTTRFERHGEDLSFDRAFINGDSGVVSGSFRLTVRNEVPASGEFRAAGVVLQNVLLRSGAPVDFPTRMDGVVRLTGQFDPLDLRIRGDGTAYGPQSEESPASWQAEVRALPHVAEISGRAEQGATNRASVQLTIGPEIFSGRAEFEAANLATLGGVMPERAAELGIRGRARGEARFDGTPDDPLADLQVDAEKLIVAGYPIPQIAGHLAFSDQRMRIEVLRIASRDGTLQASGSVALDATGANDVTLRAQTFNLDLLAPLVNAVAGMSLPLGGGVLNGMATTHGTWAAASGDVDLTIDGLRLLNEPLAQVRLRGHMRERKWEAGLGVRHAGNESLDMTGDGDGLQIRTLVMESSPVDLAQFAGKAEPLVRGAAVLRGQLSGPFHSPVGTVRIEGNSLVAHQHEMGDGYLEANLEPERWTLRGALPQDRIEVTARLRPQGSFPFEATASWTDSNLASLIPLAAGVEVTSTGSAEMAGTLSPLKLQRGEISIPKLELRRDAYVIRAKAPVLLALEGETLSVRSFELHSGPTELRLEGGAGLDGRMAVRARGAGDLTFLELWGEPITAARGPFSLQISVRHGADGWQLDGDARLDDGVLDVGLPVAFTDMTARLVLAGSRIRLDTLDGRAGGGSFHADGTIDLASGPDLRWRLQDVGLNLADNLEGRLGGRGALSGEWSDMHCEGDIEVINALYDRNIELNDLFEWLKEQLRPRGQIARAQDLPLRLNVKIYSHGGVFVENNIAKAEMWLDLLLSGNAAHPQLTGRIGILDAEVAARGRTFSVTWGTIDFRDPQRINPNLNIMAESRVTTPDTDYLVNVMVTGTADNPRVQFSSDDPGISQSDVLSLVTFGKTWAQAQRENTSLNPTAAALALLPTSGVERQLGDFLQVDRFEVTATQARDTGAIEPRVSVGKDLTDKLRALVWTSFGIEARQSVQLEYRWTRRVSLITSWESQTRSNAGAFGGDIKFRLDYRRVPFLWASQAVELRDVLDTP